MKTDGTENNKFSQEFAIHLLTINNGWIYYNQLYRELPLFKMKLDKTYILQLSSNTNFNAWIIDDWIYYESCSYNNYAKTEHYNYPFHRVKTTGDSREIVLKRDGR